MYDVKAVLSAGINGKGLAALPLVVKVTLDNSWHRSNWE